MYVELAMVANIGNEDNAWHSEQPKRIAKDYRSLHTYSLRLTCMVWVQDNNDRTTSMKNGKNYNKKFTFI